jgi:hypothetical protein
MSFGHTPRHMGERTARVANSEDEVAIEIFELDLS